MKKDAIKNIKATFEGNPGVSVLFADAAGHCFTAAAEGLTAVNRNEVDSLVADEDASTEVSEEEIARLKLDKRALKRGLPAGSSEEEIVAAEEAEIRKNLDARAEKVNLPAGSTEEEIVAAEKAAKKKNK